MNSIELPLSQAVEDFRAAQRKYIKSESEQLEDEIQESSRALRKTDSIAQIEARREEALKNLFLQQDATTKGLGKRRVPPQKTDFIVPQPSKLQSSVQRRGSLSKCKSMSSLAHEDEDFHQSEQDYSDCDSEDDPDSKSSKRSGSVKRSKSFSKDKYSDEEKTKTKQKKFANFFGKKSKSKSDEKNQEPEVVIVDTSKVKKKVEKEYSAPPIGERTSSESRKSRPNSAQKKNKRSNSSENNHSEQIVGIPEEKGKPKKGKNR